MIIVCLEGFDPVTVKFQTVTKHTKAPQPKGWGILVNHFLGLRNTFLFLYYFSNKELCSKRKVYLLPLV